MHNESYACDVLMTLDRALDACVYAMPCVHEMHCMHEMPVCIRAPPGLGYLF
jgi:hypothetical protein